MLNSVWVLLSQHTTHCQDSLTMCCVMKKKVQNVKKRPQFERVARAQYPSKVKNCTVHMQQLALCVKCFHICGFIRRHWATVQFVLIMLPRPKLTDFERAQAIALLQDHISMREVARRGRVSQSVIWRLNQCFLTTVRVQERHSSGRPKKTTHRKNCLI